VLKPFPTRTCAATRLRSFLYLLPGVTFLACASPFARASMLSGVPDCSATGGDWSCYLPGIFRFLLVIAIILGLVLAGVIFVAVKSYFKIKENEKS
jgi:hypothetical protein